MYAVVVLFRLHPGHEAAFLPLVQENAQASLAKEPECHVFDVLTDPDRPGEVFLYELYTNRAAFEVHLATGHFKSFDVAVADMVAEKRVETWGEVLR
ncbi:MAG: putative quinol monooxygenase [Pseudomonadota bacterium]